MYVEQSGMYVYDGNIMSCNANKGVGRNRNTLFQTHLYHILFYHNLLVTLSLVLKV